MNIYNINWNRLVNLLLPPDWRKAPLMQLVSAFISPVIATYNDFMAFRVQALYKLNHNSQVCYLQAVLNDEFDFTFRRIKINNLQLIEPVWVAQFEENEPVWVDENEVIWLSSIEDFINTADFTVLVPEALQPETESGILAFETLMRGKIDYYKLYSKNYIIQWVTN